MGRAATALADGASIPWDDDLRQRAEAHIARMGGEGLRVMAAAYRDLDPAGFDPDGDLLGVRRGPRDDEPGRAWSTRPARSRRPPSPTRSAAHIRVRMVTGDDVVTGAAIATQVGIPGEAILGAEFAALSEQERLDRIDDIGVVGRVAPEHKVLLAETLKKQGRGRGDDRRRRQRRPGHQGGRHRHRHGLAAPRSPRTPAA